MAEKIKKVVEIEIDVNSSEVTQLNKEIKATNSNLNQTNTANAGLSSQLNKTTGIAISGFKKFIQLIKSAAKSVGGVSKELEETEKGTEEVGGGFNKVRTFVKGVGEELKEVKKDTKDVSKETKKSEKGTSGLAGGFKKVGTAIKAAGIGLLIAALGTLVEVFKNNQGALDAFETGLTALKIAFNDLFKFFESNVGTVVDYFNELFEDPQKKIAELGASIGEGLTKRFEQLMETLGLAGKALFQFFSGDFAKAWETAKEAAVQSVDIITGEDGGLEKIVNTAKNVVGAISDYTSETLKSAKATVELGKAAEIAAIQQQGLIEEFDRAAELQRQIRDDETKSFEERIAANEKLGEILQDQIDAETALIDIQQRAVQDRLAKGLIPEFEAKKQLLELDNERAAILAKVTGFESEQLINRNSLLREQRDLQDQINQQAIERQKQLDDISLQIMEDGIDKELMMSAQKYDALYAQAEGNAELQKQITEAQEREAGEIVKKYADEEVKLQRQKQEAITQIARDGLNAALAISDALAANQLISAKRAFQVQKAVSIAQTAIDTAQSAQSSYKAMSGIPVVGPVLGGIAAAAAVAMGVAQIATIASQKFEPKGGGGGSKPSVSQPSMPSSGGGAPQFNTVGTSGFNQVAGSIAEQNQEPVKAYVVSTDVTSQQSLDRNSRDKSSF